jgi:hypothetical protein
MRCVRDDDRSFESITVAGVGDRCYTCLNRERPTALASPSTTLCSSPCLPTPTVFRIPFGFGQCSWQPVTRWRRWRSPTASNSGTASECLEGSKPTPGSSFDICTRPCVARWRSATSSAPSLAGSSRATIALSDASSGTRRRTASCRSSSSDDAAVKVRKAADFCVGRAVAGGKIARVDGRRARWCPDDARADEAVARR